MASIASGIPWPRIFSDPNRAINPTIKLPIAGTTRTPKPIDVSVIDAGATDTLPNQKRLVAKAISWSKIHAPQAPPVPTTSAIPANKIIRQSAL